MSARRLTSLRRVEGSLPIADGSASLGRLRELLERSGAEVTSAGASELRFRTPLSPSLDSAFPARDEFGPAPAQESRVLLTGLGTSGAAILYEVSMADAFDLAFFWFVFLLPLFVVSPALAHVTGSAVPWVGLAVAVAGNVANAIHLRRVRARVESSFRALLVAASLEGRRS